MEKTEDQRGERNISTLPSEKAAELRCKPGGTDIHTSDSLSITRVTRHSLEPYRSRHFLKTNPTLSAAQAVSEPQAWQRAWKRSPYSPFHQQEEELIPAEAGPQFLGRREA